MSSQTTITTAKARTDTDTSLVLDSTSVHPPFRKVPWTAAILIAGALGWLAYTFPPMRWRVPDSMLNIGALSPAEDQAALKAVQDANLFKNSLLKFSMAGLGLGLVGLILNVRNIGRRWSAIMATLVSGVIGGALAGVLGLMVRRYLDYDHPIPLISTQMRPLFADGLVFIVISVLLLLPFSVLLLFQPLKSDRHKAFAVPLAGVLSGLLVPMAGAMILSGYASTSMFPPTGIDLTVLWFAGMAILTALIVAYHGHKPDKTIATTA